MPVAYQRITNYEMAIGVDFQLENLATASPSDYMLKGNMVFCHGGDKAARFFIVGYITSQSALCTRLLNKQHSVNIIPSIVGWGRATGVIQELLGDVSAYIFHGGLWYSDFSLSKEAGTSQQSDRKYPYLTIAKERWHHLLGCFWVPVYDARSVDLDIKNFQQLPKYNGELDEGMVAMVAFTLGHYTGADGEKLSLNVQVAVTMHDALPEEDHPAKTVIDARMPLPIN
ncbi:hypothetical protein B0H14DRAFT_2645532 [Mycena olivaceomarginata]|nr:hypothetical protein B0H14DRAFT_2645532 [Mycena olivaceomarginata]